MSTHSHTHAHAMDFKKAFTVTPEAGSQVKIEGEIPFSELQSERGAAIKSLGAHLELDGFRKGHVPETILVKHLGEMAILSEMAERTIHHMYSHIIEEHNIDAIGYPQIEIVKLASENPLGVKITVAIVPTVTLPDIKKVAAEVNKAKESKEVTEAEIAAQIDEVRRQKMAYDRLQAKAQVKTEISVAGSEATGLPTQSPIETEADFSKLPLPELTDEFVAGLGQPGQFTSVEDFKTKINEHLTVEKAQAVEGAHRVKLTDAIIATSSLELPQILIDSELNQMFAQMEEDLKRSNLKIEDYLVHIKKTIADLKTEWAPAAEKRAKLQLILNEIAKTEKITPDATRVETQVKELLEHYKDADVQRVQTYVTTVLTNEAVMKMLEEVK